MKVLYTYNPESGSRIAEKKKDYIIKTLTQKFGEIDVKQSHGRGELKEIATGACGTYDVLIFAGGDGSFNEVISGIAERDNRPVLGYIPTGTVNDIARSTRIPRKLKKAVKAVCSGEAHPIDVVKVNDSYAVYVVCSGGLTGCSYTAKQNKKRKFGKIAYAFEAIKTHIKFEDYAVKLNHDGQSEECSAVLVMILNGKSVASSYANKSGYMDDGKVEVLIVKQKPKKREPAFFRHLRYLCSVLNFFILGYKRMSKKKNVIAYRLSEFSVEVPDSVVWNFDGECGTPGNVNVSVINKHVQLIMPPQKGKRSCIIDNGDTMA